MEERSIWLRLGVTVKSSKEDIENILQTEDQELADETILRLVKEGKFLIDGDWYVPEEEMERYNDEYGTNFGEDEDFD